MPTKTAILHKEVVCPGCHRRLNAASSTEPEKRDGPVKGDVTICFYCHSVLIFGEGIAPRLPTQEELNSMSDDQKKVIEIVLSQLRRHSNVS